MLFNLLPGRLGVNTVTKDISSKVNIITRVEFELANNEVVVHNASPYTTKTNLVHIFNMYKIF